MDRTLKELEREFRAGVVSRKDFFRRAALIVAGGAAAFELLGRLSPRRLAWASPGITLDPTVNPLAQGYETDGTADYATSSRLVINDASADTHRTFYKTEADIAVADVTVEVSSGSVTLVGQDTGVRAILSEGAGGVEIAAALVDRGAGNLCVALVTGGGFSQGVPLDWTNEQTFRLQRNIDPARRAVLTVSCHPPEILTDADLPPARRPNTNFEFGCSSDPASAVSFWGPIGDVIMPFAAFDPKVEIELGPPGANKDEFEVKGSFTLGDGSNGIDILTEIVSLELTGGAGGFSTTISAGSFRMDKKGRFKFETIIDVGVFEAVIRPLGGDSFEFKAEGEGFNLGAIANPVNVSLTIGDDGGSANVTAEFE